MQIIFNTKGKFWVYITRTFRMEDIRHVWIQAQWYLLLRLFHNDLCSSLDAGLILIFGRWSSSELVVKASLVVMWLSRSQGSWHWRAPKHSHVNKPSPAWVRPGSAEPFSWLMSKNKCLPRCSLLHSITTAIDDKYRQLLIHSRCSTIYCETLKHALYVFIFLCPSST